MPGSSKSTYSGMRVAVSAMNDPTAPNLIRAALRQDFPTFIGKCFDWLHPGGGYLQNWHIEAISYELERCRSRDNKRLIINLPPHSLKSICAAVAFPAFVLGHEPTQRLICVAYSNDLALKHARDFRSIINSP